MVDMSKEPRKSQTQIRRERTLELRRKVHARMAAREAQARRRRREIPVTAGQLASVVVGLLALATLIAFSTFLAWLVLFVLLVVASCVMAFTKIDDGGEFWLVATALFALAALGVGIGWAATADHSFTVACHKAGGQVYTVGDEDSSTNYCTVNIP